MLIKSEEAVVELERLPADTGRGARVHWTCHVIPAFRLRCSNEDVDSIWT